MTPLKSDANCSCGFILCTGTTANHSLILVLRHSLSDMIWDNLILNFFLYQDVRYNIYIAVFNSLTPILLTWRIWWALNIASKWQLGFNSAFKGLNDELNPICHLLALLGAHHILHVSWIRVKYVQHEGLILVINTQFFGGARLRTFEKRMLASLCMSVFP